MNLLERAVAGAFSRVHTRILTDVCLIGLLVWNGTRFFSIVIVSLLRPVRAFSLTVLRWIQLGSNLRAFRHLGYILVR